MANLRAARQAVYAQEGKFFPLVNANFNPTNQLTAGVITPVLNSSQNPFTLYTAQSACRTRSMSGVSTGARSKR